jgi:putative tricarboxylic transport membrane protein
MASNTALPVGLLAGFRLAAMAASVLLNTPKNKGTGEEMQKYNLRNGDVVSGAFLAALGLYIVAQAYSWNYYNPDGPGPGFFPTWYGLLMIGLALALIISTARKPKPQESPKDWDGSKRALITWFAFAACIATMGVLGFRLSFALFTFFLVVFVFQRTLVAAVLTSVGATAAFYIVFPVLLGVQLPIGWFGF